MHVNYVPVWPGRRWSLDEWPRTSVAGSCMSQCLSRMEGLNSGIRKYGINNAACKRRRRPCSRQFVMWLSTFNTQHMFVCHFSWTIYLGTTALIVRWTKSPSCTQSRVVLQTSRARITPPNYLGDGAPLYAVHDMYLTISYSHKLRGKCSIPAEGLSPRLR